MKVDLYTKMMLTVVACCLLYIVAKDISLVKDVRAQSGGVTNVNIVQVAGKQINEYDIPYGNAALPVKTK